MGRSFLLLAALVYRAQCFSDRDLINEANPTKTMCYERRPVYGPPEMGNGGFVIKSTLVSELNGKYTPGQQYSREWVIHSLIHVSSWPIKGCQVGDAYSMQYSFVAVKSQLSFKIEMSAVHMKYRT